MMEGANNHEEPSPMKKVKWTEWNKQKYPLFVGACFSSRFYTPTFVFEYFIFCDSLWRGVKLLYWREVLGFLHFEGKFWVSFILTWGRDWWREVLGFPEREEILTLVADQGLRSPLSLFSSLFVWYLITGAWGPARVYLFPSWFCENGKYTTFTLCTLFWWQSFVILGLRTEGDALGALYGCSAWAPVHPVNIAYGPHRASSLHV